MYAGLLCLLIASVGGIATFDAWRRYRRAVLRWPTAPGRILERSVREAKERARSPGRKRWEPVVRYTYEVAW